MTINKRLQEWLDSNKVEYEASEHPTAFTASETAAAQHVPGNVMVKPVIVKDQDQFWMCIISAAQRLDFDLLKKAIGDAEELQLASEEEVIEHFPDFEPGAEPPFAELGKEIHLIMDEELAMQESLVFNGGTHRDAVQISGSDYQRVENPEIAPIARHL